MEVLEKKFPSQRYRLLAGDDVTLTSHQHHHNHRHHHRHDHHRRPLLRSSSSLLRNLVSPVAVCLLLCMLVNPVLVQTPRARSQHFFRFRGSPDSSGRRNNTSALSSTPAENVVRTAAVAAARYLTPATVQPILPSRTTMTTASNMTMTTTTRGRRRPSSLRKILEGEDVYWTTRRRSTSRPLTTVSVTQRRRQPRLPIVARIRVEPVAAGEFRRRLKTARSYRDVVRIFVRSDERLRDEDIDDFITSPLMTSSAAAADAGNNSNSAAAAAALQSIIVGSSGRQSVEDNRLPTNEWEMTLNHYTEMQNLGECRLPVAKFIQVRNHELARSDSDYLPECTVVYRCHKEFGCCNSTSECGVKTSTYVYRPFWEITCLPNSNCSESPVVPVVKTFQFVNHTECECKPIRHLPRCLQCPLPFVNVGSREELFGRCNCSCDAQNQHCIEISTGVIPLETDEINCVRDSTCERPFCTNGEYDVDTGFCPCPLDTPDCRSNHESQTQGQEDDDDDDDDDDDEEVDDYVTTDEAVTTTTTTTTTTMITATTSNEQLMTTEEATNSSNHDQQ